MRSNLWGTITCGQNLDVKELTGSNLGDECPKRDYAGFTVGGTNYALLHDDASGSSKRPGTGLAVELDPGKLLEVWLASSSVYRRTP